MTDIEHIKASYHAGQADARLNVDLLLTDTAVAVIEGYDVDAYRRGARDQHALDKLLAEV